MNTLTAKAIELRELQDKNGSAVLATVLFKALLDSITHDMPREPRERVSRSFQQVFSILRPDLVNDPRFEEFQKLVQADPLL